MKDKPYITSVRLSEEDYRLFQLLREKNPKLTVGKVVSATIRYLAGQQGHAPPVPKPVPLLNPSESRIAAVKRSLNWCCEENCFGSERLRCSTTGKLNPKQGDL